MALFPIWPRVRLENFLVKLNSSVRLAGVWPLLSSIHEKTGLSYRQAAEKFGLAESNYRYFVQGRKRCPLSFVLKFGSLFGNPHFTDDVFALPLLFSSSSDLLSLPKEADTSLAYFVGYLQGDGYICSDRKKVEFVDEDLCQIRLISALAWKLFGTRGRIYSRPGLKPGKLIFRLILSRVAINSYLHAVFGVPRGIKTDLKIPRVIKAEKELLRWYLRGLFDADGTLPKHPRLAKQLFIDIALKDKAFIIEIRDCLTKFGVETLAPYPRRSISPATGRDCLTWELRIRRKAQIVSFLEQIGFVHKLKNARQRKLLRMLGW